MDPHRFGTGPAMENVDDPAFDAARVLDYYFLREGSFQLVSDYPAPLMA